VLQANSDFSAKYSEQDELNLSLSCLSAFIMDQHLEKLANEIGLTKAELSSEGSSYEVLNPGSAPSTSSDRVAFLSALNLLNRVPVLRIDGIVSAMQRHNIKSLRDAHNFPALFSLETKENDAGAVEIITCNIGGHTNLILNKADMECINQELTVYRQKNAISDQAINLFKHLDAVRSIMDLSIYPVDEDLLNILMTTTKRERYTVLSNGDSIASIINQSKNNTLIQKLDSLDMGADNADVNLQEDARLAQNLNDQPYQTANNQYGMFAKKSETTDLNKKIDPDSNCIIS
jgi:hypothetical protein